MKTSNLFTTLSAWVLGVFLCMGSLTAYAVDEVGLFELESDAVNVAAEPPDDWETLCDPDGPPGTGAICQNAGPGPGPDGSADVFTGILDDPLNISIFDGGKKDIQLISSWSHKDGAAPDKDEIIHAYAAAYTNVLDTPLQDIGDLIIYFGADRYDGNGDATMGFWFFQDEVAAENDGTFSGDHIPGDVLVLANYPQSNNAVPIIEVLEWDPTCSKAASNNPLDGQCAAKNLRLIKGVEGDGARCTLVGGEQLACATSNTEAGSGGTNDPTPSPWPYLSKDGDVNEFPGETFLEGGINLSQLLPEGTGCFSSFMAETRTSESFTATLKDFVLDKFELCGIAADKDCEATLSDAGDEVSVEFNGTVSNTGSRALTVTLEDDMGDIDDVCFDDGSTPGECNDGNTLPANLSITLGVAEFDLLGGDTVLYEGSYIESSPVFDVNGKVTLTDEVTVTATLVNGEEDVVDTMADAECDVTGIPDVDITKECTAATANGTDLVVSISGTGSNTGQLKLVDVGITDSEGATITQVRVDDDIPPNGSFDTTVTNGSFTLLPGQAYDYIGTLTILDATTLEHSDTATVSGLNFFDQLGDPVEDTSALAECEGDIDPGIAITKECDLLLARQAADDPIPERIVLEVSFDGVVRNTGDVELTNVTVTDSVVGVVLSGVTLAPNDNAAGGDDEAAYSGSYFPTIGAGDPIPTASEFSSQDTAEAEGTAAFGGGAVNTDTGGSPPATATAECFLCDDDHDGIPDVLDEDSSPIPD